MTMDKLFLAFHVMGVLLWVGGLFALMAFLEAYAGEPDAAPRTRLLKHVRSAAIVPDVGATIAMLFGAHWLFRFKLYEAHYMHAKLALVALVLVLHVVLRLKVKKARKGEAFTPPPVALKPVLTLTVLGILIFVIAKIPA